MDVILALRDGRKFILNNPKDGSLEEFFKVAEYIFIDRYEGWIDYEQFISELYVLVSKNIHLRFSSEILKMELNDADFLVLMYFCYRYSVFQVNSVYPSMLRKYFCNLAQSLDVEAAIEQGVHQFITHNILENDYSRDLMGFETDEQKYRLTNNAVNILLSELSVPKEQILWKDIKTFLENSVYYPACAFDGSPIKCLSTMFSNYVYADYYWGYNDLKENIAAYGLKGYELINESFISAEELFGLCWEDFISINHDTAKRIHFEWENPYAVSFSFNRCASFNDEHGREKINILYIKAEGISAYKYLYVKRNIAPKCIVSIVPGTSFGGNFSEYPYMLSDCICSTDKLPEYQFYDNYCGSNYLLLNARYNIINEYTINRMDYTWSTHFTLAKMDSSCIINKGVKYESSLFPYYPSAGHSCRLLSP